MARGQEARIREHAQTALLLAGVTRPEQIDAARIADALNVEITYGVITGATERISMLDGRARIRIREGIVHEGRKAFTTVHAVAHKVCGHLVPTERDAEQWIEYACGTRGSPEEHDANRFAVHVLTPELWVRPYCTVGRVDLDAVRTIAAVFPVSPVMAARRLIELTQHACAVVYSEHGSVKWSNVSRAFPARIPKGFTPPTGSIARGFFDSRVIADATRAMSACAWLPMCKRIGPRAEIIEHAQLVPEPEWGGVLSLLWLPEFASDTTQRAQAK